MAAGKAQQEFPPSQAYENAAQRLERWLGACVICPRGCKVNRLEGELGFCRGQAAVAAVNTSQLHFGEEPPISGSRGSGTIFFSGCTMGCRYCQNYQISQQHSGEPVSPEDLAGVMLGLEMAGAHNLNLVTPTPHLVVILKALGIARGYGCKLPVVYNTSGYERAAVIRQLDGLIDIYMPDFKYADNEIAARLSDAPNYVEQAKASLAEMVRQVGNLEMDQSGVAARGVLIRHLVLPGGLSGSEQVLRDLAAICGPEVWVSLMSQYRPTYMANETPGLERKVSFEEYEKARQALEDAGISRGFVQGMASSRGPFMPEFKE